MTSPFLFESMLAFGWLASMLLIGVFLRAWTPFFQRFLFPSCLNVDSMAFQAALVGLVYLITYAFVKYIGMLLPPDAAKIMWGFFFVFGLVFAILIRMLLQQFGIPIQRATDHGL